MKEVKEVADTVSVVLANGQPEEVGNVVMQEANHALLSMGVDEAMADKIDNLIVLLFIIGIALLANLICRKIILRTVARLVRQIKVTWNDTVFNDKVVVNISRMMAPILIYTSIPIVLPEHADLALFGSLRRFCMIYIPAIFLRFASALLIAVYLVYSTREQYKDKPLKGLLQTAQVIFFFIGTIIIISTLIKQSPAVLLTGLGASAAVLILIFKGSIMGSVSGIQLSINNVLKVGDWIIMPRYGADGIVIEVTLNTVKICNLDNIITAIPPYPLISDSFQNWQGMQGSGGRRARHSINIDMTSVHFCTPEMLAEYRKIQLLKDYVDETEKIVEEYNKEHHIDSSALVNGHRQTDPGIFRAYLTNYLKNLPTVGQDPTYMVCQPQPTETSIPLELYFFSVNKIWVAYEDIQADVFGHALAIIPESDLRVFQNPSGADLHRIGVKIES